jgi:hypothetical protein
MYLYEKNRKDHDRGLEILPTPQRAGDIYG